jgi:hypothetical protein
MDILKKKRLRGFESIPCSRAALKVLFLIMTKITERVTFADSL